MKMSKKYSEKRSETAPLAPALIDKVIKTAMESHAATLAQERAKGTGAKLAADLFEAAMPIILRFKLEEAGMEVAELGVALEAHFATLISSLLSEVTPQDRQAFAATVGLSVAERMMRENCRSERNFLIDTKSGEIRAPHKDAGRA